MSVTLVGPTGQELRAVTDDDGRVADLLAGTTVVEGTYQLRFDTGTWFAGAGQPAYYPEVTVTFGVEAGLHHHVPLLLSPFAYSTYRGS